MDLASCHCCGLIQTHSGKSPGWCARCQTRLREASLRTGGNTAAAALAMSAVALYPLAIVAPFLRIEQLGYAAESSLIGGIVRLITGGHIAVGLVVLVFSIVLPIIKLLTLIVLSMVPSLIGASHRARTYRLMEHLGRWGMLDVLLVAVLIAFVKMGDLISFDVGPGLYLFCTFVTLNLLAGLAFNPHILWDDAISAPLPGQSRSPATTTHSNETDATNMDNRMIDNAASQSPAVPSATSRPARHRYWWLLPISAVLIAVGTATWLWPEPPHRVAITFPEGHGLKPGNAVRYKGIDIGVVEQLELKPADGNVQAIVSLDHAAAELAKQGTNWWIVRPELSVSGAAGLETILGDRFITLQPGDGAPTTAFVGLDRPPLEDLADLGGMRIVLQASAGPRLVPGAGLFHRGVRIGGVESVDLASDASAIEYRVYVRPRYRSLVTRETVFWNTGGLTVGVGLEGVTFRVDSLAELVTGGMALAVPSAGEPVPEGTRFILHEAAEDEWNDWQPSISTDISAPTRIPKCVRVTASWTPSGWVARWTGRQTSQFLAIDVEQGLVAPIALLPDDKSAVVSYQIGQSSMMSEAISGPSSEVDYFNWPTRRCEVPEDALIVTDHGTQPIAAAQWISDDEGFRLPVRFDIPDGSLLLGSDEKLIGFLHQHRIHGLPVSDVLLLSRDSGELM